MKYFIDTEFSERGPKHPIELISIGIVAEDGRELYAVNSDFKPRHANQWVKDNVLPLLPVKYPDSYDSPRLKMEALDWFNRESIAAYVRQFVQNDPSPEFWGYYSAYDWVVLCQLFGDMSNLPTGWPMFCHDLRQWLDHEALHHVSQPDDAPHNALEDARWVAETYKEHAS